MLACWNLLLLHNVFINLIYNRKIMCQVEFEQTTLFGYKLGSPNFNMKYSFVNETVAFLGAFAFHLLKAV